MRREGRFSRLDIEIKNCHSNTLNSDHPRGLFNGLVKKFDFTLLAGEKKETNGVNYKYSFMACALLP